MTTRPPAEAVHRALSSPARSRLLDVLRDQPEGHDVHALATHLDLHPNTVRAHLGVLQDAGLVAAEPEARQRPGRPRMVYRATGDAEAVQDDAGYAFLATILTGYLATTADDPSAAAEEAGAAWGRHLVDRPPPFQQIDPAQAIATVVEVLADIGFAPELDDTAEQGPRILLRRCPFLQLAKAHPEIVCAVHLGIMRGALRELGADVEARDLQPLVEPMLCITHLAATG